MKFLITGEQRLKPFWETVLNLHDTFLIIPKECFMKRLLVVLAAAASAFGLHNAAAEPVKIGMITTLSTKAAYLGEDIRDGFQLAVE